MRGWKQIYRIDLLHTFLIFLCANFGSSLLFLLVIEYLSMRIFPPSGIAVLGVASLYYVWSVCYSLFNSLLTCYLR